MSACTDSPSAPPSPQKRPAASRVGLDQRVAILLGICSFGVYLRTLCPTIYLDDTGEIATAVATGGVIHPPGYPLYSLLGLLVTRLIPLGEPAWRLGLLSSVFAALAVATTFLLCRKMRLGRIWSALAALSLAFTYTLWQQATKVETYALNAFLVAMLLYMGFGYLRQPSLRNLRVLAIVGGIALTNHLSIIWLIPALIWLAVNATVGQMGVSATFKRLCAGACLTPIPLILYLYEPVAASLHRGGEIWGDPTTPYRFYLQVTGALYHGYLGSTSGPALVHRDLVFLPSWMWRNLGVLLVFQFSEHIGSWLAPADIHPMVKHGLGESGLVLAAIGYTVGNSIYGIQNIFEYYTPMVIVLSVLGAFGAKRFSDLLARSLARSSTQKRQQVFKLIAYSLAIACPCAGLLGNWRVCDRSGSFFSRDLALNTLRSLPQRAVLVANGDTRTFALWYVQDVLGVRPDVTVVSRSFLFAWKNDKERQEFAWGLDKLARHDPSINAASVTQWTLEHKRSGDNSDPLLLVLEQEAKAGRTLCFTTTDSTECDVSGGGLPVLRYVTPRMVVIPIGLGSQAFLANHVPTPVQCAQADLSVERMLRLDYVPPEEVAQEPDGALINRIYAWALTNEGIALQQVGRYDLSLPRLQTANVLDPANTRTEDSYALSCLETGNRRLAIELWKDALVHQPSNCDYRHNLQVALMTRSPTFEYR